MSGVAEVLSCLGGTPAQIADTLWQLGIRGVPGSATRCPIAVYLDDVYRGSAWSVTGLYLHDSSSRLVEEPTPLLIMQFLDDFDSGRFEELAA